jgi:hypothetical protein
LHLRVLTSFLTTISAATIGVRLDCVFELLDEHSGLARVKQIFLPSHQPVKLAPPNPFWINCYRIQQGNTLKRSDEKVTNDELKVKALVRATFSVIVKLTLSLKSEIFRLDFLQT